MNDFCIFLPLLPLSLSLSLSLTHVREFNVPFYRDSAFGVVIRIALIARAYINNAVIFQQKPSSRSAGKPGRVTQMHFNHLRPIGSAINL